MARVAAICGGLVATVAVAAGFVASLRWLVLFNLGWGWWVVVRAGRVGFGHERTVRPRQVFAVWRDLMGPDLGWEFRFGATSWDVYVPLWFPLLVLAGATVGFWLWRRRVPAYVCARCGYDLRGARSGVCPECGASARIERPA